jgi:hypothetical protein
MPASRSQVGVYTRCKNTLKVWNGIGRPLCHIHQRLHEPYYGPPPPPPPPGPGPSGPGGGNPKPTLPKGNDTKTKQPKSGTTKSGSGGTQSGGGSKGTKAASQGYILNAKGPNYSNFEKLSRVSTTCPIQSINPYHDQLAIQSTPSELANLVRDSSNCAQAHEAYTKFRPISYHATIGSPEASPHTPGRSSFFSVEEMKENEKGSISLLTIDEYFLDAKRC